MQRLLLDTHTLLWWLADCPQMGPRCRNVITEPRNQIFISAATTWEIAIKMSLGKIEAPEDMDTVVSDEGFSKLPITLYHGQLAGALPRIHRDPFDRMLIAQAQAEGLILVTADTVIARYGVRIMNPRA